MLAAPTFARPAVFPRHADIDHSTEKLGDWTLETARNRFSETIVCRLRSRDHRIFFENGAVAFRFKSSWNVNGAVYRLDGADPHRFYDDIPTLLSLNAPFDRGGINNSTAGIVWIPYDRLRNAETIEIQALPTRAPVLFQLRGLNDLHDRALKIGCSSDRDFIR